MTPFQGQVLVKCGLKRIYLAWDVPGEITVGSELEMAGLLGSVIHNLNIPRLHIRRHRVRETITQNPGLVNLTYLTHSVFAAEENPELN